MCSKLANIERIAEPLLAALSTTCGSQQPSHGQEPTYVLLHYLRTISEWLISSTVKPQQDASAPTALHLLATILQRGAPWLSSIALPPSLVQALATKYGAWKPAAPGEATWVAPGLAPACLLPSPGTHCWDRAWQTMLQPATWTVRNHRLYPDSSPGSQQWPHQCSTARHTPSPGHTTPAHHLPHTRCVPAGAALDSSSLQQLLATLLASYPSFRPSLEQYVLLTDKLAAALLAQLQDKPGSAALPQLLHACTTALGAFADMAAAHPAPKKVCLAAIAAALAAQMEHRGHVQVACMHEWCLQMYRTCSTAACKQGAVRELQLVSSASRLQNLQGHDEMIQQDIRASLASSSSAPHIA